MNEEIKAAPKDFLDFIDHVENLRFDILRENSFFNNLDFNKEKIINFLENQEYVIRQFLEKNIIPKKIPDSKIFIEDCYYRDILNFKAASQHIFELWDKHYSFFKCISTDYFFLKFFYDCLSKVTSHLRDTLENLEHIANLMTRIKLSTTSQDDVISFVGNHFRKEIKQTFKILDEDIKNLLAKIEILIDKSSQIKQLYLEGYFVEINYE